MAFRGRGRGRGGFGFRPPAKQEPFELFPAIKDEDLGNASSVTERTHLAVWYSKLQKYWTTSPYYLGDENHGSKQTKSIDIERFSDSKSDGGKKRPPLSHFITMDPAYFPVELVKGERRGGKHAAKRVRWNQDADSEKLDLFEKLEQKSKGQDDKKDGEDDEEEADDIEVEDEEFSDDGDYNQNIDFDDDEDDYNMSDDGHDDEGTY